jgi:hypothetical protein
VEVVGAHDDLGPVGGHALDDVPPAPGQLQRGLDRLGAGVHRQHEVLAAQVGQLAGERPELVVAEGSAGQRQPVELGPRRPDQAGVTVPEVERRVGRQHVEVAAALIVDHPRPLPLHQRHRQRGVVGGDRSLGPVDAASAIGAASATVGRARHIRQGHDRSSRVQHFTLPPPRSSSPNDTGTGW